MAVKIRVTVERKEYNSWEITLSDKEYQKFKKDLHGNGRLNGVKHFKEIGDELLEHPTAKYFDCWGSGEDVVSVTDTFEDEVYTD